MFYLLPRDRYIPRVYLLRRSLYTLISLAPFTPPPIVIVPTIHARYELFIKLLLLLASPASRSHPPRSLFPSLLPLFFSVFSQGFFVQNKMASFWHWKKKYSSQPLPSFSISLTPSPFRSLNNRNPSYPTRSRPREISAGSLCFPSSFAVFLKKKKKDPSPSHAQRDLRTPQPPTVVARELNPPSLRSNYYL